MPKYIKDRSGVSGVIIGLAFPIDVGYKAILGTEAWKKYLKDQDTLFAEWTTFRAERDLLATHIRGEIPYEEISLLLATAGGNGETKPEYGCGCVLPEQTCGGCKFSRIQVQELPF